MAQIGQVYYNVIDPSAGDFISNISSIYSDIVSAYGASQFNKLGIQAPPGTQVVLNKTKNIMLGRTGMYELDDDIAITSMYFVRPQNYILDQEATDKALADGIAGIMAAEDAREKALAAITSVPGTSEYMAQYNEIQAVYKASYDIALNDYEQGLAGIYKTDGELKELFNVIVDFIYV